MSPEFLKNNLHCQYRIPYGGSEWAIHAERARQAIETISGDGRRELENLDILAAGGSQFTPTVRQRQEGKQNDEGWVPGGFVVHILMDHAPGIQLDERKFWSYSRRVRDRIREAFKAAWMYVFFLHRFVAMTR